MGSLPPELDGALEWAATAGAPTEKHHTDWCQVKGRMVRCPSPVHLTNTMGSLSVLWTDPLPTGCLRLQIRSGELPLDHTPTPNPLPEAGRQEALGGGRARGRKWVWAPHF